jgi:hypothetical protein
MRSPDTSKPPFHAKNQIERQEMKEYLLARLYEDDGQLDDDRDWESMRLLPQRPGVDPYIKAKRAARRGNLQPLAKILSTVMDDPEIADFLAAPPRGRGKPSVSNPYRQFFRGGVIDMVRRIRKIWRIDYGLVKRDRQYDDSAEKIAGEIYGLSEHAVLQIMKKV